MIRSYRFLVHCTMRRDEICDPVLCPEYNPAKADAAKQLLYDFLSPDVKNLPVDHPRMKFRANRSLRDVEPEVNIWDRAVENSELEEEPG
jgi:hypothetical protein